MSRADLHLIVSALFLIAAGTHLRSYGPNEVINMVTRLCYIGAFLHYGLYYWIARNKSGAYK